MTELQSVRNQVPPEVGKLWAQLHAEALGNYELLRAQKGGVSPQKVLAIGIPLALLLVIATLGGLFATGNANIPAFACNAADGLCTPTPTIIPTATPYPTFTPLPPTPTHTPSPTPTPTPTPLPYGEWLGGCTVDDFGAEVVQASTKYTGTGTLITDSLTELTVMPRSSGPVEVLITSLVLTNTGSCLLVEAEFAETEGEIRPEFPEQLNPGRALTFEYLWPELAEGTHTVTLTLRHKNAAGRVQVLEEDFVLTLDLTILVDRDGDGIPDIYDACPDTPGLARFSGCPDTDGDGIPDHQDCCPDTPGLPHLRGCPDSDGDGFPDRNDRNCPDLPPIDCCPDMPGTVRGCPDSDGDGFPDTAGVCTDLVADACPDQPCAESTDGCPTCWTEYDRCPVQVCETVTDPNTNETKEVCRTEYEDCNPREVCTCP